MSEKKQPEIESEFLRDRGDVVVEMGAGEQTGSIVLNVQKLIQDCLRARTLSQQSILDVMNEWIMIQLQRRTVMDILLMSLTGYSNEK